MGLVSRRAALLVLLAGCLPARHEYVGGACDEQHRCPDALFCVDGRCRLTPADAGGAGGGAGGGSADAGTRINRLANGGFEEGPTTLTVYWSSPNPLDLTGQQPRTGAYAARLSTGGPADHLLTTNGFQIALNGNTGTFCSEAWLLGAGTATATLTLTRTIGGMVVSAARPEAQATLSAAWTAVRTRLVVEPDTLDVSWEVRVASPGATTLIDDVVVWPSPSGSCAE